MERKTYTTRFLYSKVSSSTLSDEVVEDEEEAKSSTQSIQIEESLLAMTHFPNSTEVYEIYDISYSHMTEPEEGIQISDIE